MVILHLTVFASRNGWRKSAKADVVLAAVEPHGDSYNGEDEDGRSRSAEDRERIIHLQLVSERVRNVGRVVSAVRDRRPPAPAGAVAV